MSFHGTCPKHPEVGDVGPSGCAVCVGEMVRSEFGVSVAKPDGGKATIAELEAILNDDQDPPPIQIHPDGSLTAETVAEMAERLQREAQDRLYTDAIRRERREIAARLRKLADQLDPAEDRPHETAAHGWGHQLTTRHGGLYQAILQLWFRKPDGSAPNPLTDPPDEATGVMQDTREQTAAFLSDVVLRHWDKRCGCQAPCACGDPRCAGCDVGAGARSNEAVQ